MKTLLLLALCVTLVGCETYGGGPSVKLNVAEDLRKPCPVDLPDLVSSEDKENLKWTKTMLSLYAKCAKDKELVIEAIDQYNLKVLK